MAWQPPRRKYHLSTNGTVLALIALCLIYYTSWTWLRPRPTITTTDEIPLTNPPETTSPRESYHDDDIAIPGPLFDDRKLAFLTETRPLPHLPALFAHMAAVIPPEWKFKFMGSSEANDFMRDNIVIKRLEDSGKLDIVELPANYSLTSRETISQMFTDAHLYRDLLAPAEHLLVFQPDSIFCANAPRTLNDFLMYDWIGAPWGKNIPYGGNGGLSLRRVSKILKVLEKQTRRQGDGALEDLWLSNGLRRLPGTKMAHANISKTFSVESVWDDAPLGYHIGWLGVHHEQIWDQEHQVKHVLEYCPEVKMILGMKLDNDKPATIQKIEKEAKVAATRSDSKQPPPKKIAAPSAASSIPDADPNDSAKLESQAISLTGADNTAAIKLP